MKTMEMPQLGVERGSSSGKEQAGRARRCEQVQIHVLAAIPGDDSDGFLHGSTLVPGNHFVRYTRSGGPGNKTRMSLMAFHCHETMAEVDCEVPLGMVPGLRVDPTCFYEEMMTEIYLLCEIVTRMLQRMVSVHYVSS
jgi:hypothetical protein